MSGEKSGENIALSIQIAMLHIKRLETPLGAVILLDRCVNSAGNQTPKLTMTIIRSLFR